MAESNDWWEYDESEAEFLREEFKKVFEIYEKEIFPDGEKSIMCKLDKEFCDPEDLHHNCLGCNFSDFSELLRRFLKKHEQQEDTFESFVHYILLTYLLVERFDEIFEIIKLPEVYRKKHFGLFSKIRKWTNFIKHPKAFILVHHPRFYFENDKRYAEIDLKDYEVINENNFITNYYKHKDKKNKNDTLSKRIQNKKVVVILPNIVELTKDFCKAQKKFVDVITKNEVYQEILKDKSTFENYFSYEELEDDEEK